MVGAHAAKLHRLGPQPRQARGRHTGHTPALTAASGGPPAPGRGCEAERPCPLRQRQHGDDFEAPPRALSPFAASIRPATRRFRALDVPPELFDYIRLMKAGDRIGGHGRVVHAHAPIEAQVRSALRRQAEGKRHRGYR